MHSDFHPRTVMLCNFHSYLCSIANYTNIVGVEISRMLSIFQIQITCKMAGVTVEREYSIGRTT